MIKKYISAGDKVELKSAKNVVLPDGTEGKKLYRTVVYDMMPNGNIAIVMPMEQAKLVLLPVDGEYEAFFFTSNGMYKATIRITDRKKANSTYVLIAEFISTLTKFQRREYYRFNCVIEMDIRALTQDEEEEYRKNNHELISVSPMEKGVIVDISGGGLRFVSKKQYSQGSVVYMKFELVISGKVKEYELAGRVIYSNQIENRTNEYENRVKYLYMSNIKREEIIKYIFDEERKNRKNGKGR